MVLHAAGSSLGGPLGSSIGAMIGGSIDSRLLGGAQRGPRIGDLSVQASSYGTQIPRIYGRMRVAGTVIWSTDLQERGPAPGSKSQPNTPTIAYTASFCVALSSRPLKAVQRIWADGKLIRGAAGDFKIPVNFRFYPGDEDQMPDPLIASAEGVDRTSAFRGLALAVFEDLPLASFGNRLPMLTFEVVAAEVAVAMNDIVTDLSNRTLGASGGQSADLMGYAAYGSTAREALQPILDICDAGLVLPDRNRSAVRTFVIDRRELGCNGRQGLVVERRRQADTDVPDTFALTYYEPEREYQTGQQQAGPSGNSRKIERVDLAAVLTSGEARRLAEQGLLRRLAARERITVRLPLARASIRPGDAVQLPGEDAPLEVVSSRIESFSVVLELIPQPRALGKQLQSDPGRSLPSIDVVGGPTSLLLAEVMKTGLPENVIRVLIAAAGGQTPWQPTQVDVLAGDLLLESVQVRRRAVVGNVCTSMVTGAAENVQEAQMVEVQLASEDDWLQSCDDLALAGGANLALIGDELIQFGSAEPLGERKFRLARLLRGRLGTGWAMHPHVSGESFLLCDYGRLVSVDVPLHLVGSTISAIAHGAGDRNAAPISRTLSGDSQRAIAPVHVTAQVAPDGALLVRWLSGSTLEPALPDEASLTASSHPRTFQVEAIGEHGAISRSCGGNEYRFEQHELNALGPLRSCSVLEIGRVLPSRKVSISL